MSTEVNQEVSAIAESAPEVSAQVETSPAAPETTNDGADGAPEGEPAAYTPNWKFKVLDKEYEIDEFARSAIKSAEHEQKMKELYQKAHGLDHIKPKYQQTRETLSQVQARLQQEHEPLVSQIRQLGAEAQKGELEPLLQAFKVSDEVLFKAAQARLKYRELPAEEKARIDREKELSRKAAQGDQSVQTLQQAYVAQAVEFRSMQLDHALGKPEIQEIAQAMDARFGKPGAFRSEVIKRGQLAYISQRQDIPVDQLVKEVAAEWGPFVRGAQASANPATPTNTAGAAPQKKVIPNIGSSQGSPARKEVRSIADLKKLAAEMNAASAE